MEQPPSLLIRWMETLSSFNFDVEFRNGTAHGNADALSRIQHVDVDGKTLQVQELAEPLQDLVTTDDHVSDNPTPVPDIDNNDDYKSALANDSTLSLVKKWILSEEVPSKSKIKGKGLDVSRYHDVANLLFIKNGRIFLKWKSLTESTADRLCVPKPLQRTLVEKFHGQNRTGVARTTELLKSRFFFPGMTMLCREIIDKCSICQRIEGAPKPQMHTLKTTMSDAPWQKLAIDLVGPMKPKSSNGNSYILTAKCCFTRWIEAIPICDKSAKTVALTLYNHVLSRFGMPKYIHSDHGREFDCDLMKEMCKLLQVKKTFTPAYNAKSNPV